MPTLDDLLRARYNAIQAGDRGAVLALDAEVKLARNGPAAGSEPIEQFKQMLGQQRESQAGQEPDWPTAINRGVHNLPSALYKTATEDIPALAGSFYDKPGETADAMMKEMVKPPAGLLMKMGIEPRSEYAKEVKAQFEKNWGSSKGAKERFEKDPLGPIGELAMVGGPASSLLRMAARAAPAGGRIAGALGGAADVVNPALPVRGAASTIYNLITDPKGRRGAAQAAGIPRASARIIGEGLGEPKVTDARLRELGPTAMVGQLNPKLQGMMETLLEVPMADVAMKNKLFQAIAKQAEDLPDRLERGFADAIKATPESEFESFHIMKGEHAKLSPEYQRVLAARVDIKPIKKYLNGLVKREGGGNPDLVKDVNIIRQHLDDVTAPKKGKKGFMNMKEQQVAPISKGWQAQSARAKVRDMIEEEGGGKALGLKGEEAYQKGKRTNRGRWLDNIRDDIGREMNSQMPELGTLDLEYRKARELFKQGGLGRRETIGSGPAFTEPENLAARALEAENPVYGEDFPGLADAARRRGLTYAGADRLSGDLQSGLSLGPRSIDVAARRRTGKRIQAVTDKDTTRRVAAMVKREDLFSDSAQDALRAYERGQKKEGAQAVDPRPAETIKGAYGISPTTAAALAAGVGGHPLIASSLLLAKGLAKPYQLARGKKVSGKTQSGIADVLSRSGPEAKKVTDAMKLLGTWKKGSGKYDTGLTGLLAALGLMPEEQE